MTTIGCLPPPPAVRPGKAAPTGQPASGEGFADAMAAAMGAARKDADPPCPGERRAAGPDDRRVDEGRDLRRTGGLDRRRPDRPDASPADDPADPAPAHAQASEARSPRPQTPADTQPDQAPPGSAPPVPVSGGPASADPTPVVPPGLLPWTVTATAAVPTVTPGTAPLGTAEPGTAVPGAVGAAAVGAVTVGGGSPGTSTAGAGSAGIAPVSPPDPAASEAAAGPADGGPAVTTASVAPATSGLVSGNATATAEHAPSGHLARATEPEPVRVATPTAPDATAASQPLVGSGAATAPATVPTTASAPGSAGAPTGGAVLDQVGAQLSGLVSRGDGTQRIRLRLHPESLGEVSVVLTVRKGVVAVTLAASGEARVALEQGAVQLRRLLEHAGAQSTQLLVKELPGQSPTLAAGHDGASGWEAGRGTWTSSDQGRDGDRPAGSTDSRRAGGPGPDPSTNAARQVAAGRPASLDVLI